MFAAFVLCILAADAAVVVARVVDVVVVGIEFSMRTVGTPHVALRVCVCMCLYNALGARRATHSSRYKFNQFTEGYFRVCVAAIFVVRCIVSSKYLSILFFVIVGVHSLGVISSGLESSPTATFRIEHEQ